MKHSTKVFLDPGLKVLYASYYIQGLYDFFGRKNVRFSSRPFRLLKKRDDRELFDHYMAFVLLEGATVKRYIIDFWDKVKIDDAAYEWCDVYAKINVAPGEESLKKLIPIPPGFGIHIWNRAESLWHCIRNFILDHSNPYIGFGQRYDDYMSQYRRPGLEVYESRDAARTNGKPYVFMIGRLWPHKNCLTTTNPIRLMFIEVCREIGIDFEGGFYAQTTHPEYERYRQVSFTKKMDVFRYVARTKQSFIAFNTPAVHDCHGWKLGEYLAMGKAVISTPLSNYFPLYGNASLPLHTIGSKEALREGIEKLLAEESYRNELSRKAEDYYRAYASPRKVIEGIMRQ